jgi:hypothetical protein
MSTGYQIGVVTVTPTGGGWYELSHSSLTEPQREQGKDKADAAALALSNSLASTDPANEGGTMPPQPPIDAAVAQQNETQQSSQDEENAKLREQLAAAQTAQAEEQAARLEAEKQRDAAIEQVETKTVVTDGEAAPAPPPNKVPAGVPRHFGAALGDKEKAALKRMGIETTDIVLEENETIPPTGLFLSHNGRGYVIVPGEQVTVPNFLLGVLNDAVMSAAVLDSKTQKVIGYRNRMRYPYRVV